MTELDGRSDRDREPPAEWPATTGLRMWAAEGARVGLVSCLECGAALLVDPDDARGVDGYPPVNVIEIHREWHARQARSQP